MNFASIFNAFNLCNELVLNVQFFVTLVSLIDVQDLISEQGTGMT